MDLKRHTLKKIIHYIKYECSDDESRFYAASPYVSEILRELLDDDELLRGNGFKLISGTPLFNSVISGVKRNIERTIEWSNMSQESKEKHLKNLLDPYEVNEEVFKELLG